MGYSTLDEALSFLNLAIYETWRLYDPARALNIEGRINNAFFEIRAIQERNAQVIAWRLKHCENPRAIKNEAPECEGCPNYSGAFDGTPICTITGQALQ